MNDAHEEDATVGIVDGSTSEPLRPMGEIFEERVAGDELIRVQVLVGRDGAFGYRAQCGYQACDGPFRDSYVSVETFPDAQSAMEAGIVKARQLAGIDVPEA